MQIKQLLTISIVLGIVFYACHNNKHNQSSRTLKWKKISDTLYFGNKYMQNFPLKHEPISDSLGLIYMSRTHYIRTNVFTNLDSMSYKNIYSGDTFFLGNNTWGKIVFFENRKPQLNNTLQLYLLDQKKENKDILEIGATFDDAGTTFECYSLLLLAKNGNSSIIFTKIYDLQRMFEDIDDGGERDVSYLNDTIFAHQLKNGRKYPFKLSPEKQKELRQLFVKNRYY